MPVRFYMTGWYRRQFGISCPLEQSCPLFQDLAVCRMSFAQRLANKARATRNILRDEWIEETLEEFMEECQEAAEDGKYEHKMRTDVPSLADEEATDEAIELVNEKLAKLGFTEAGADGQGNEVEIWAEWDMPAKAPGKSKARGKTKGTAKGIKGDCPICFQNRHLVAFTPCGHTVCKHCHSSSQLGKCPMCRKKLTGATEALFMG